MRVGEAGQRAAAREVEALDAARRVRRVVEHGGDPVAVDEQRGGRRPRRVHRADRPAVQEEHARQRYATKTSNDGRGRASVSRSPQSYFGSALTVYCV